MNDEKFTIKFVNKNASKRVNEIIKEIKSSFELRDLKVDDSPMRCLEMVDSDPSLLLRTDCFGALQREDAPPPPPPLPDGVNLRVGPTTPVLKQMRGVCFKDKAFEAKLRNITVESRAEHQRVLRAFQERLISNVCERSAPEILSPFRAALVQAAKEQAIPIHLVDGRISAQQPLSAQIHSLESDAKRQHNDINARMNIRLALTDNEKEFDLFYQMLKCNINHRRSDSSRGSGRRHSNK